MNLDITKHGDALEREFSDLIINKLPYYNSIWSKYIGHDGLGKMLNSVGLNELQEEKRIQFAEYHYTILESIIGMQEIISTSENHSYNSVKDLIRQNNDIISFHAHVGRIRDCIKKIGELFNFKDIYVKFEKYWNERCAVLHSKKLPFSIIDGIYFVLKDAELIEDNTKKVQSWNDFTEDDFDFLYDYLNSTFESMITEINSSLAAIYSKLKSEFPNFRFDFKRFKNDLDPISFSGSTVTIKPLKTSASMKSNIFNYKKKKK